MLAVAGHAWEISAKPGRLPEGAGGLGEVRAADEAAPPRGSGGPAASPTSGPVAGPVGFVVALGLGLLGGLVLNLMPCVFPVLAMKAAALARHAQHGAGEARAHGLAFMAGTILTFVALAGLLLGLRAAGQAAGWGFQLQTPAVTAALALLMLAVALNLSGVFEAGLSAQRAAGSVSVGGGVLGAFATGVLAVLVAAPCTAPFMAAAVGYALTASAPLALCVFAAMGLGLALPFAAVSFTPALLARLPRPGPWMEGLRHVLAFPMYGAAAWLAWVFVQQTGAEGLGLLFAAGVALAFALYLFGGAQRREAAGAGALIALLGAGVFVTASIFLAALAANGPTDGGGRRLRDRAGAGGGALLARAAGRAARPEPAGVRQLDRRLVRDLQGQRARGPVHARGAAGVPEHAHGLPGRRLDAAGPGDRPHPGRARPRRGAALSGLSPRRRRARGPAPDPHPRRGEAGAGAPDDHGLGRISPRCAAERPGSNLPETRRISPEDGPCAIAGALAIARAPQRSGGSPGAGVKIS